MQPHEGTKSAAGVARARMFIRKELGWMQGLPLAAGWVQVTESATVAPIALDRERLRLSAHTITMLRREFPRALPRLVGDVERWTRTHQALLDLLKPSIHAGAPLPVSPLSHHPYAGRALLQAARRLEQEAPQLQTWRTALEWYGWTDLAQLRAAFAWLTEHAAALTRLRARLSKDDPVFFVRLWQLTRAHSPRRVAPLIALLANESLWQAPLECPEDYLPQVRAGLKRDALTTVPRPPATLPQRLIAWLGWLGEQEATLQRRGLELLVTLFPTQLLVLWPAWWAKVESTVRQLRRATKATRPRLSAKLERLHSRPPPAMPAKRLDRVLRGLTTPTNEPLYGVVAKALALMPPSARGCAWRLACADHWLMLWQSADEHEQVALLRYIPAFADYAAPLLSRTDSLMPWKALWSRSSQASVAVDQHALSLLKERQAMTTYFRVLRGADVSSRGELRLLGAFAAYLPSQRVESAFMELRGSPLAKDYAYIGRTSIRFCQALTLAHPQQFAPLLVRIEAAGDVDSSVRMLRPVAENFAAMGLTGLLIEALVDGQLQEIVALARKLVFTQAQGMSAPILAPATGCPAWLANYPAPLHDALAALAQFDPAAEQSAAKALAKEFPERHGLEQELARLRAIEQPTRAQQGRIDNLMKRLTTTRSVSAQRLDTLAAKLRALVRRRVLDQWRSAIEEAFLTAVPAYLGVTCSPDWITEPEVMTAIAAVTGLSPTSQALARRVLAARAGSLPWDLRDAPANHAYLVALRARGIELAPWLDDATVTEHTTTEGQVLRLSIERDPLAILNMGGHFDTCLSPGQCNFFSVFANIADINKQVLYARTVSGTVFGRVLLALTNAGGLMTFHRYAHGSEVSFKEIVKDFVHNLARRMNTLVVDTGSVATLVADRWYDDGSVDLAQQIPALEPDSPLRHALPSLPPAELVATLTTALAPLALNELTLPYVLALPELAARSELVLALLPLIERTPLGLATLLDVVRALARTPDVPLASLLEQVFQQARRVDRYQLSGELGQLLAEHAPVLALRLLRMTRDRNVRAWDDEEDDERLFIAACASEKLRRRHQARSLYELALARAYDEQLRVACRSALERLA